MSEPTTAAGRALHMRLDGPNVDLDFHRYGEAIAAIENEAAAAARAALLEDSIKWADKAAAAARTALLDELEVWARDGKQPMWRTARLAVLEWINRRRP